jgi:beta-lactamase regulating signal transducer with metallopeptidase domain
MQILAESAVRAAVLALGVAIVLRALRISSPRLAHGAWTAVVVVMLLLPALVAWGPRFAVPLLTVPQTTSALFAPAAGDDAVAADPDASRTKAVSAHPQLPISWEVAAVTVYVAGVVLFLLRLAIGLRGARTIHREALHEHGRLAHSSCVTPMTIGILAPVVVLPLDWARWDDADLSAVLAHEEEHVRRRDPLVMAVALLNRAVFWFHPLAWWLPRRLARLSEQACDAAVISRGHDRDVYSACLLRFARRAIDAGGRIVPVATMPGGGLQERLRMLAYPDTQRPSGSRLAWAAVIAAALVVVCAAAAPAPPPQRNGLAQARGPAAWLLYPSEHFDIYHADLPADRLEGVARDAEDAYAQLSAALEHDLSWRVPIVLVQGDRELPDTAAQTLDPVLTGGPRSRVVISLESLDRRTKTIVHELTHQFAFDIAPEASRIAPYLIEGLAEHQRGMWRADDLRMTRDAVALGAIPSVATLADSDRHWAHTIFDFVAAQRGDEGIRGLLLALRAHDTLVQSLPAAFGVTLDQFDRGLREYVTARFGRP